MIPGIVASQLLVGGDVGDQFAVTLTSSGEWFGAPLDEGYSMGANGGESAIESFLGSIAPGAVESFDGVSVGMVIGSNFGSFPGDIYFLIFLPGATGSELFSVSWDGLDVPLDSGSASFISTDYGSAFSWFIGNSPDFPSPWDVPGTFNLSFAF